MELRFVQINLHHSKAATANLVHLLQSGRFDVALVQEPWVAKGRIKGLQTKELNIYSAHIDIPNGKPRTCIVARKQFNLFLLTSYSNADQTVVTIQREKLPPLIIVSCYMPYDGSEGPPPDITCDITKYASRKKYDLLMGCDSNSHHVQWGSTNINHRGESLLDFILLNNLLIINRGNTPTFVTKNRSEVIDITLTNNSETCPITNWRVLDNEVSFSDHCLIEFNLPKTSFPLPPFRNIRRTNWQKYNEEMVKYISNFNSDNLQEPAGLDRTTSEFTEILNKAFEKSCPQTSFKDKGRRPLWWSNQIGSIRKETRRLFNAAKRSRSESDWEAYKASQRKFKIETQRAKRNSWRNFCSQIECTNESARLRKILSKDNVTLGSLKKDNNEWTESCGESLELLVNTHFPGCEPANTTGMEYFPHHNYEVPTELITKERVKWAINSFSPFKSAGLDGIFPMMLQVCDDLIIPHLMNIFHHCLKWGFIPSKWREAKIVFIPKAGKPSHTVAKDFRPISLTSFVLKTLERLLDIYIRSYLDPDILSPNQHAYVKGKSVETALHCVVRTVEHSLNVKEYTLAAFLDIEGAFNNVRSDAIGKALIDLNVNNTIAKWVMCMLENRHIQSELRGAVIKKTTSRGTPQGGILSPLLWVFVMNDILNTLKTVALKQ